MNCRERIQQRSPTCCPISPNDNIVMGRPDDGRVSAQQDNNDTQPDHNAEPQDEELPDYGEPNDMKMPCPSQKLGAPTPAPTVCVPQ